MPHYFFDTSDGDVAVVDEVGSTLDDDQAARKLGLSAFPDMARDIIPDGDRRQFVVKVRRQSGEVIYYATLTLEGAWIGPTPTSAL